MVAETSSDVNTSILEEAARIVDGPRRADYGTPLENHSRTAALWSAYLGVPITPRQVCMLNVLQKVSRDAHAPKRDNLVDVAGYARNAELCEPAPLPNLDGATTVGELVETVEQAKNALAGCAEHRDTPAGVSLCATLPYIERCSASGPHGSCTCSLRNQHRGPHVAYTHHDIRRGDVLATWG